MTLDVDVPAGGGTLVAFIGPVAEESGSTGWSFWTCGTFFFVPLTLVAGFPISCFFQELSCSI